MSNVLNKLDRPNSAGDNVLQLDGTWKISGVTVAASAAELNILDGATATAAELNLNDVSAQTETVIGAGAVSIALRLTNLALVGAGAVTLAVPGADMLGVVKVITMTADNGDVTLALTNVTGQSAGTTATFNSVGDALVLVGGVSKWHVVGEAGIALA